MVRETRIFVVFFVLLASGFGSLSAELITHHITAEIGYVDDRYNLLNGLTVGDMITGTYTYESSTPDLLPLDEHEGAYLHTSPPCGWYLTAGGFVFQTDPANVDFMFGVIDHDEPPKDDAYVLYSYNNLPFNDDVLVDEIHWQLVDTTCTILSADALPTAPPVLDDWDRDYGISIQGMYHTGGLYGPESVVFWISAPVLEVVPEPTTILLFAISGLAVLRRNRRGPCH